MASPGGVLGPQTMWLVLGVAALALFGSRAFSPEPPTTAEPFAQLVVGDGKEARVIRVEKRECQSRNDRLWVEFQDGVECIAYATAGSASGGAAVLYFSGDMPQNRLGETQQNKLREAYAKRAQNLAKTYGLPFVMIGRPGLLGSTGFHLLGGRRDEAAVISATIDAVKRKLSVGRLALAGQSGGSRIIAQLMVNGRRDIACAAMSSGAYGVPRLKGGGTTRTNVFGNPGQRYLVPLREIEGVVQDSTRRSFVIGDKRDAVTPFSEQEEWAQRLRAQGHHVVLIEAEAKDPERHGLSSAALAAAALCAKGRTDGEIRSAVQAKR